MQLVKGETIIQGRKGGAGKAHTPVEQDDDLLSVAKLKMVLAVAEGEIQGDLTPQQIFLDNTPLANDDGTYNFTGVSWDFRAGTQDQTYVQGMPEIDNEASAGIKVTDSSPWVRQFTNLTLDAVRIKLSLPAHYLYKDNGDMVGTVTQYAVDLSTDGGAWQTVVNGTFNGKTTSEYQRDHRIELPSATSGWSVRVRRITADSTSSKLVNAFSVYSYAEVIDSKLRYPNTALLYIELDSSQFNGSVPKTTCKPKGKLIKVPTTYDPVSRSYSGTWTGDFKLAYSNNPAWIFYDLVLDEIYGMGTRVDASMIDKWELYAIAQYCDEKVSNGSGGTEPRFTCNVYIQNQEDAYNVLKDIAAIFRGITFWGNSQIFVNADVPQDDVDFVYHASNVVDGLFTYAGGSYKNRYTSCQVSWSDPHNHYADTVEGVYDTDLVQRYGVNETQLTAIGCTSQSEAHRRGRWAILSNAKDGTISFGVGLDGYIPLPAEIIGVADPFRAGRQNGGRLSAVNGLRFTLDRAVDYSAGDRLVLNLPDGTAQTRTIASISADKKTVTVNAGYSQTPVAGAVWAIDSDNLAIQYYRVTSIASNDDGTFTVSGVQHDPNKYRYIDDGVKIEPAPITITPSSVMSAPTNIVISETDYVAQGLTVASMNVSWDKVEHAIKYTAQWRKDNGDWVNVGQVSSQGFTIQGIYAGVYDVRVRAVNASEVSSPWGYAESTSLSGKVGKPGTPVNFSATDDVVWNVNLTWGFPDGSGDTAATEIQQATTSDGQNATYLVSVAYPGSSYQHGPMPAGVRRWYRARLVDRIGNTGDWTEWTEGDTSIDATAILGNIVEDVLTTDAGKQLVSKVDTSIEGILQNALDADAIVDHQMAESGKNRADILTVKQTIATNDRAYAQKFDQIQATVDTNSAAVQQTSTAVADINGKLSAQYSVKVAVDSNGRQYAAGMGIGVENTPAGMQTQVLFLADRFAVMSAAGGSYYSPFAIQNGQVFINQALIADGTITNAKIGSYIQSANYVAGSAGWSINKSGSAEFSNATVRGSIYASSGTLDNVTINNTCTILGTLNASRINGPLMQAKSFNFAHSTTNASSTIYWDGTAGKGDVPMTLSGRIIRQRNNGQGASKVVFNTGSTATTVAEAVSFDGAGAGTSQITEYSFSFDVGTASANIQLFAGSLNQGAGERTNWSVQIFAAPTANQFHT